MNLQRITPGTNPPEDINVIIEIPAHGAPVKYEMDKTSQTLSVDRFMSTAMYYPANYGYVPQTLSEDGDPVDVLAITPVPLIPGTLMNCRPIGVLCMEDEAGVDEKILAVPNNKLTTLYHHVSEPSDLPESLLNTICHFFTHYKDLEAGKWVKISGWAGSQAGKTIITQAVQCFKPSS